MRSLAIFALATAFFTPSSTVSAEDEVTLFDARGKAVAYVALDDDLTIYLWSGKPVAYLDRDSEGGFHVYGFNGKHLGWFVEGVVWDHEGNASCGVQERLQSTEFEPFKSFKQFKPFKSFQKFAPFAHFSLAHLVTFPVAFFLLRAENETSNNAINWAVKSCAFAVRLSSSLR